MAGRFPSGITPIKFTLGNTDNRNKNNNNNYNQKKRKYSDNNLNQLNQKKFKKEKNSLPFDEEVIMKEQIDFKTKVLYNFIKLFNHFFLLFFFSRRKLLKHLH